MLKDAHLDLRKSSLENGQCLVRGRFEIRLISDQVGRSTLWRGRAHRLVETAHSILADPANGNVVNEQTLEIRTVEVTGSSVRDALMLPSFLTSLPPMWRSARSPRMAPMTRANDMIPSPTEARLPSLPRRDEDALPEAAGTEPGDVPAVGAGVGGHRVSR